MSRHIDLNVPGPTEVDKGGRKSGPRISGDLTKFGALTQTNDTLTGSHLTWHMKRVLKKVWQEWLRPFALVFVIVGPLKSAVADWNWVPTGSMKPSILEGELVAVNKLAYDLKIPFTAQHLSTWPGPPAAT